MLKFDLIFFIGVGLAFDNINSREENVDYFNPFN
jgi:hypothetical protein